MPKLYLDYGRASVMDNAFSQRRTFRYAFKQSDNVYQIGAVIAHTRGGAMLNLGVDPARVTDKLKEIVR